MKHSVELDEADLKIAVQMYVSQQLNMDASDVTFNYTPGSNDPRESFKGYVTASAQLRRPAQGKD